MAHKNTIASPTSGNDYFLGCNNCHVGLVMIYKNVEPQYRQ